MHNANLHPNMSTLAAPWLLKCRVVPPAPMPPPHPHPLSTPPDPPIATLRWTPHNFVSKVAAKLA